jgi:hydroxymethylbilane synthase
MSERTLYLATRGSALALAQANLVIDQCRALFSTLRFEVKIIKTTGDKLQAVSLASANLPKGLFTKELEMALVNGEADLAIHSLKDLPTTLPDGLHLGAVSKRADVRDVLIYRDAAFLATDPKHDWAGASEPSKVPKRGLAPGATISQLPQGATVATSSTRRSAQLLEHRPDLKIVPIRGNVGTRLNKLAAQAELDAIVLAAAGLERLGLKIGANGSLRGENIASGLLATAIDTADMLPCVGQAALGIEIREDDPLAEQICDKLNDSSTMQCVRAERAFLRGMGGGCQIPVGAFAEIHGQEIHMRVVSFLTDHPRRAEARGSVKEPEHLGRELARTVGGSGD